MLGGYIWYPILGHLPITEAIQDLKYNALVTNFTAALRDSFLKYRLFQALGYRDFDEGVSSTVQYLKRLQELKITVLCANINTTKEPAMDGLYQKSMIITINDQRIGIIGYIGTDADVRYYLLA